MSEVPAIDILPRHWDIVSAILRKHVPDREVWAFGSRVVHRARRYSDLDLAIIGDTPLSWRILEEMADDFSDSDLPWMVDILDWASTSPGFRKIIEREKVVIQRPVAGKEPVAGSTHSP